MNKTIKKTFKVAILGSVLAGLGACDSGGGAGDATTQANAKAEVVKIAFIDPLSGLMAPVGTNQMKSWQHVINIANEEQWAGPNIKFELVPFDNKLSPQESLTNLKKAIDSGIRYVVQGNGSSVGIPLMQAVAKHNERNPNAEVLYLNYAAVDPDMTNSKCEYWHFSLDANSNMKMNALTSFLAKEPKVQKVYLLNQNYSHGHQVSKAAVEMLGKKRPDVKIVGNDLHPLAQVKDFSPYIAKIRASGADTVITGNWGSDLALLIKAAKEAGLDAKFYTYYASTTGTPTAMGTYGVDHVKYVGYYNPNDNPATAEPIVGTFLKKYKDDFYVMAAYTGIKMLSESFKKTNSTDPKKVASSLEGTSFANLNGNVTMRAADHQIQQPLVVASWTKVDGKAVTFDQEGTGYGWKTDAVIPAEEAQLPTTCNMPKP